MGRFFENLHAWGFYLCSWWRSRLEIYSHQNFEDSVTLICILQYYLKVYCHATPLYMNYTFVLIHIPINKSHLGNLKYHMVTNELFKPFKYNFKISFSLTKQCDEFNSSVFFFYSEHTMLISVWNNHFFSSVLHISFQIHIWRAGRVKCNLQNVI